MLEEIEMTTLTRELVDNHMSLSAMTTQEKVTKQSIEESLIFKYNSVRINDIIGYRLQKKSGAFIAVNNDTGISVGLFCDMSYCTHVTDYMSNKKEYLFCNKVFREKKFLSKGLFCDKNPLFFRHFFAYASAEDVVKAFNLRKKVLLNILNTDYELVEVHVSTALVSSELDEMVFHVKNVKKVIDVTNYFIENYLK